MLDLLDILCFQPMVHPQPAKMLDSAIDLGRKSLLLQVEILLKVNIAI
jgi:hypothetical protein